VFVTLLQCILPTKSPIHCAIIQKLSSFS
jgi:hypothetical protein